jgi:hypothetical protein
MLKDWPKVYRKLRGMRGLSVEEKVLLAQGLAATPEERWRMHDQFLRSFGLYSHWERKKLGFPFLKGRKKWKGRK